MRTLLVFLCLLTSYIFPQSKKEQIAQLTLQLDSILELNTSLERQNDSIYSDLKYCNLIHKSCTEEVIKLQHLLRELVHLKALDSLEFVSNRNNLITELIKLRDSIFLNNKGMTSEWIFENLGVQIPKGQYNIIKPNTLPPKIKSTLFESDYWLGIRQVKEVSILDFYLRLDLSNDDYTKKILLSQDYLIISYHLNFGSEGNALLVDLNTMSLLNLQGYFVNSLESKYILNVERDFYDNEGRVWETGKFYIKNKRYEMITRDN